MNCGNPEAEAPKFPRFLEGTGLSGSGRREPYKRAGDLEAVDIKNVRRVEFEVMQDHRRRAAQGDKLAIDQPFRWHQRL